MVLDAIKKKLKEKHQVEIDEVREAFYCATEDDFVEERLLEHLRTNKKIWFIAPTFSDRLLKVILELSGDDLILISAYDPDEDDLRAYETFRKENKGN